MSKSLERLLGLPGGIINNIMENGLQAHYRRFLLAPKKQSIRSSRRLIKRRSVSAPSAELKLVQRAICHLIAGKFTAHPVAHAYERGRSIFTNASRHAHAAAILKIDLVNFFGSIGHNSVLEALRMLLVDVSESDVLALASLCCFDGFIAQGAPVSPALSNLVCYNLDRQLFALACQHNCKVTRYSDDITFSTSARAFPNALGQARKVGRTYRVDLGASLVALLENYGFEVNRSKVKFATRPSRLKVTGLILANGLKVPKEYWRNIRAALHQWERLGIQACARRHHKGCETAFTNSLRGSIEYVGQAQGRDDDRYQHALTTFKYLLARDRRAEWAPALKHAACDEAPDGSVFIRDPGSASAQ